MTVEQELADLVAVLQAQVAARDAEIARLRAQADRHAVSVQNMERRADEQARVDE